jgi:hypothetical protein
MNLKKSSIDSQLFWALFFLVGVVILVPLDHLGGPFEFWCILGSIAGGVVSLRVE